MQRDWIDYASAAGSVATALTLIYLVVKEWKTRKHVTDLTVIAEELKKQQVNMQEQNALHKTALKANARPNVSVQSIDIVDNVIHISLINRGKVAFPVHFEYSGNVIFDISYLPHSLDNDQTWEFNGTLLKADNEDHYCILMYYKDMLANYYYSVINGMGQKIIQLEIVEIPKEQLEYLQPMWNKINPF